MADSILRDRSKSFAKEIVLLCRQLRENKIENQMVWMVFYVVLYAAVYSFALDRVYGLMQMAVVLAIPVIALYSGKRGRDPKINQIMKYAFYIYYPLHLVVLAWFRG